MIYLIDSDGKTVRQFVSLVQLEWAVPREMQGGNRIFAVHPKDNDNCYVDPITGRWVYDSPVTNSIVMY